MKNKAKLTDKDLVGSQAALQRAARSALATARNTGTPCYVLKHGKVVDIAAPRQADECLLRKAAGKARPVRKA